ncbi:hypothetical protein HNQ51_001980 [Inhella inkyongensis]|uniref:Uncharacterized protein n=1 Tax=Inhella inkyongensis TaxID=392593 RepID=A0A840S6P7_9BURK|nr:hypothetical protein [Inhella inkyongensis]MBB5204666.1 hypothetical protein [Inhella inkyongensis]
MKTSALALLLTALLVTHIDAQAQTARAERREARQEERIQRGAANGSLTAQETLKLEKEQARIDQLENKAAADGVVTGKERRRIETAQDAASRDIRRKKHNGRTQ